MKRSLFLSGLLAFTILVGSVSPAMAQPGSRLERMAEKLDLTDTQKNSIQEIFRSSRSQVENILTPAQRSQLETAKQQGMKGRKVFKSLNLSQEQKQQIKTIRQNNRQQISQILTPEQRQNMQEMRQNKRGNR
ncbi:MAG: Spy/CpxP family protein refolding chaperone [Prochloraceae cyanobacterium]